MTSKVRIYSPKEAAIETARRLKQLGFSELRNIKYHDSGYLIKSGFRGRKIRISNHRMIGDYHVDVVVDLVYDYPTIINDIDSRVKRAVQQYAMWRRVN